MTPRPKIPAVKNPPKAAVIENGSPAPADPGFLRGDSEMAGRIRGFDWSDSPVGPIESWSPALRTMLGILLANRFPMLLWWGPRYISFYNDAYRPILGVKHPVQALGVPVSECWSEIWPILRPLIDTPFQGGPATWMEDIELEIKRHGFLEETHFTIAYSPVPDESVPGNIGGVLATVHEITGKIIGERRMLILRDLAAGLIELKSVEEVCRDAAKALSAHAKDVPFALFYLIEPDQKQARLVGAAGIVEGALASPRIIELGQEVNERQTWPLGVTARTKATRTVEDLAERFGDQLPPGPWSDPPLHAVIVPLETQSGQPPAGFLICGVSSRLKLDHDYRSFIELLARQISTGIATAHNYTEQRRHAGMLAEQNLETQQARRAALNLMEDAVQSARIAEALNAQVRASEERYRTLFNSMDEGFCVIEIIFDEKEKPVDYRFLEINPSFEKLTGMHGALGKRISEFVPDLEAHWYEFYAKVARTGEAIRVANEVKGMNRWFDIYAFRIGGNDSRQVAVLFRNITERMQAERHTAMLTALSRELAGATEETEIVKIAVEAAGRHLGGHRCYFVECLADENRLLVSHNWVRDEAPSLEGELSLFDFGGLEWWREFASGNLIIEDVATNPLTHGKSASYHAVDVRSYAVQPFRRAGDWTVCLGITEKSPRKWTAYDLRVLDDVVARVWPLVERARADRALRESEAQLRLALDSAELGSWNMDPVTYALSSDARFRAIFGVTAEGFSYERALGVIHPDDRDDVTRAVAAAIRPDDPVPYEAEYRVVHPDGALHWVFAKGRANFGGDAAGRRLLSFDGTVADITDRKRAEMNVSFLASVSDALANLTDLDEVMGIVGAKTGAHLHLSACAFVEIDEAAGQLVVSHDWHREDVPGLVGTYRQADLVDGEFARRARAGEIIVVRDTAADARTTPEKFAALKIASFICAPLIREGQWRFALCLYHSKPHPWRDDEVELARELTVRLWTRLERLRAEAELRESEERYRNLFNSIDEGFCIIELIYDGEGKPVDYLFLEVNPSFEKQTGMKNAAGRRVLEILPNLEPYWLEFYGNVAQSGEPLRYLNYAKGWDRWFDVYGFRIGEAGSHRVAVLFTDVSSRERNELARSYQAKLLAAIAETTGQLLIADSPLSLLDSIFGRLAQVLGAEFHLSHLVSDDGTQLILKVSGGLDAEQRRTCAHQPFQPPQPLPGEGSAQPFFRDMVPICAAQEATMTRIFGARAVVCHPLRVGRRVFGTFSLASARRGPFDEQELRVIHTLCDLVAASMERTRLIHAVSRARDVAEQANISKDLFLAALSHELRTPLTPVLLLAAEAIEDPAMPVGARKIFTTIVKNVRLEARLIDDLLDATRISHGKLALEMQVVDVDVALRDAIETVASELKEKRIALKLNLAAEKPLVMGDPVRLQQIFWNVLRNAVKFSPTGGEIAVETAILPTGLLRIKITDRGMGMTKEELARLFTSFSQGDHAGGGGSHRFGGLGLGLSISRRLTELHSGTIRAESAGLNEGSTFLIELPLSQPARVKEFMRSPAPPAPRLTASRSGELPLLRRILLVEDHESTRTALTDLLTRRRYEVVGVGSLAEARAAVTGASFDLLISDLGLPDGTGHELMAELRTRFGLTGIALTGYGRDEDVARGREAGFVTHLTKPVSLQLLEAALAAAAAGRGCNRK